MRERRDPQRRQHPDREPQAAPDDGDPGWVEGELAHGAPSGAGGGAMALLDYDDLRRSDDPKGALLNFLESAYLAGATHANWDVEALRHDYADYVPLELP